MSTTNARTMYKMQKGPLVVFAELGYAGLGKLRQIRRNDSRFRRARIVSVLQCFPAKTPEGKIMEVGS